MRKVEDELIPYGFARCNVCYLVNLRHVTKVEKNVLYLGATVLDISRAKRKEFIDRLTASAF